jgi:hypothetical protein
MKLFVWNSAQYIASLFFQTAFKVQTFFKSKLRVKACSLKLKMDSYQTHQHKTNRLIKTPTKCSLHHSLVYTSLYQSPEPG